MYPIKSNFEWNGFVNQNLIELGIYIYNQSNSQHQIFKRYSVLFCLTTQETSNAKGCWVCWISVSTCLLPCVGQHEHDSFYFHHSTVHPTANFSTHLKCCRLFWQCEPAISGRFLARINCKVHQTFFCKSLQDFPSSRNTSLPEIHNHTLTCVILSADAGVASLSASAHSSIHAGV